MRRMRSQNKERKLGSPFPLRFASEFRTQKKTIRKRLNEQFPNRFVDEEETSEQQPDHEKPKSDNLCSLSLLCSYIALSGHDCFESSRCGMSR